MNEPVSVQWFPGHMAKTRRLMERCLPLIDGAVEIADARIPASSRNPELDSLLAGKPRLLLLNKADMADEQANRLWLNYFEKTGTPALPVDCKTGKGLGGFARLAQRQLGHLVQKYRDRGITGRTLRLMVVGIPNVGKSSFINRMAGGARAKVADRPGVTRGNQWFAIGGGVELLDTAGVLWPKFDDPAVGERLAFTGAVRDVVVDVEALAARLLQTVGLRYGDRLCERYRLPPEALKEYDPAGLLEAIGKKRGMLLPGGVVNTERTAVAVVDDYRAGKWGRITLELPEAEPAPDPAE